MKVEGKIDEGGKVEGLAIFPSFGTTLKKEGMIIIVGSHNKYVSALWVCLDEKGELKERKLKERMLKERK
jgi:hypothetical protein